jgi:hypothetical protein
VEHAAPHPKARKYERQTGSIRGPRAPRAEEEKMSLPKHLFIFVLCLTVCAPIICAQQTVRQPKKTAPKTTPTPATEAEIDPAEELRRTTAISLVTSLADEAKGFRDPVLRARVQARAADALWETETERARTLFRRAWDEAETADAEADRRFEEEKRRQLRERGSFSASPPTSLRAEVLRLAAKRDRALGEEFLTLLDKKRKEEADRAATDDDAQPASSSQPARNRNPSEASPAAAKRLRLAIQLLEDGDVTRAMQFADPALAEVSGVALEFLTRLRGRDAKAADERYAMMVARAVADPTSDANTASVLSSYLFTPTLYVTFTPDAGSNTNSWGRNIQTPPDVSPQLRAGYFNAAASILLRPIPPPEQDRTSSGRAGAYMAIARLLTLFDQFAPDKSPALRARLAALAPDTPEGARQPGNNALTRGLVPEDPNRDRVGETLNRLNRARTSEERDAVYVDAVFDAMRQKDPRVEEFLNKIEDADLRRRLRAYVDFESAQQALRDKEWQEAVRLARGGNLSSIQKAWALTEAAKLIAKDEPGRAIELLEEALTEAKERIDAATPERPSALVAIATQMLDLDRPRAWEVVLDAIKASNSVGGGYTGEDGRLTARLQTKNMTMMMTSSAQSFDLSGVFAILAREDLTRAISLARNFESEAPRAAATLAIARAALEKR